MPRPLAQAVAAVAAVAAGVQDTADNTETGNGLGQVNDTETNGDDSRSANREVDSVDNVNGVNNTETDEGYSNLQAPASFVPAGPNNDYIQSFRSKHYLVPHWRNVLLPGRSLWSGSILLLSFRHGAGAVSREELDEQQVTQLEAALTDMAAQSNLPQAVFVRDISNWMMNSLGPAFNLSPEVFEEHLVQSGFTVSSYEDPDPNTWPTRFLPKQHVSLRWFSPVLRKDMEPRGMVSRRHLLSNTLIWDRYIKQSLGRGRLLSAHGKRLFTTTNIFRQEWPLSAVHRPPKRKVMLETEPGYGESALVEIVEGDDASSLDSEPIYSASQDSNVVAWEERVTFCWGSWGQERRRKLTLDSDYNPDASSMVWFPARY